MALTVRVITPDQTIWDGPSDEVILPATSGQLGILFDHAPLLTALGTGVMRIKAEGQWHAIAIMGGFAEVEENEVTVLVNRAEKGTEVDRAAAEAAQTEADKILSRSEDKQARMQAKVDRQRAVALIQAADASKSS